MWQLLTLSKDHVKRVRTEYDGGKLNVLISCDSSLNDGVKLVFLQPKNIPELLKVLFRKELAEPVARPNGFIKKISKSAGTLLIDTAQVQAKKKARLADLFRWFQILFLIQNKIPVKKSPIFHVFSLLDLHQN